MLGTIAIVIAVPVAGVLAYAATRPDTFRVERSQRIDAPPEAILPLITDFRRWKSWSPYEDLDPNLKRTYEGSESGEGAIYRWDGDNKAGAGSMEILEVDSTSKIVIRLRMTRPMPCDNRVEFTLVPEGEATRVSWSMEDPKVAFMAKVFGVFVNMDKMLGETHEKGLADLKAAAEG